MEFRLNTQPAWLIELVSVRTSDSARRATREIRPLFYEQLLRATEDEPGRGAEGEMITAQQKIGEKVFSRGGPTKFPSLDGSLRLILVDIRGYLDEGGDHWDYYEMANGRRALPAESREFLGHFWKNREGKVEPIKGLFERGNQPRNICESEFTLSDPRAKFSSGRDPRLVTPAPQSRVALLNS